MTHEDAFFRAILDDPEDDTPRLVYADWLEERGDPRGEFIRLQCQLARLARNDPLRPELEIREEELLGEHGSRWAGPFLHFFSKRDLLRGRKHWTLRGQKGSPAWLAFTAGGLALVTATQEWDARQDDLVGAVRVWDLRSGTIRLRLKHEDGGCWAAVSPERDSPGVHTA